MGVLAAEVEGRVVGVVTVEDRGEELELVDIDVPLDLQGQGIGTRIVRFIEEDARARESARSRSGRAGTPRVWPGSRSRVGVAGEPSHGRG